MAEKQVMTGERQKQIDYLVSRAYPRRSNGTRGAGNREFYAELCEQPDHILSVLYQSAMDAEIKRKRKLQGLRAQP